MSLLMVVNQRHTSHNLVSWEQIRHVWHTPLVWTRQQSENTEAWSTLLKLFVHIDNIENVEEPVVGFDTDLRESHIFIRQQLRPSLTVVAWGKEAFIKYHPGDLKPNRVIRLRSDLVKVHIRRVLFDSNLHIFPNKRIPSYLSFKQIWMVTDFPELHD